jgi:hypothetical protein
MPLETAIARFQAFRCDRNVNGCFYAVLTQCGWRHGEMRRAEDAGAGGRCSVRLGHRHAGDRFAREARQGTEAGADCEGLPKRVLAEKGLRIEWSGAVDKTQTHRPLVNIYRANGKKSGEATAGGLCQDIEPEAAE